MSKLILTRSEKVTQAFLNSVKNTKTNVVAVLSSKPYMLLRNNLAKSCKGKECVFIDTVEKIDSDEVIYIPSSNLTALSIAINQALQPMGKCIVIFDSFASLSINNSPDVLIKFFSFVLRKSKDWNSEMILVASEEGADPKLISMIKQFVDKVEKK